MSIIKLIIVMYAIAAVVTLALFTVGNTSHGEVLVPSIMGLVSSVLLLFIVGRDLMKK